jgi:YVTN family beta-propeller protein
MKRLIPLPKDRCKRFSSGEVLTFILAGCGFFTMIFLVPGIVLADSLITTIPMLGPPFAVTFNPDNNKLYVSLTNNNFLSVIDGGTNTVIGNINTPFPFGSTFSPVDHMIYVTNYWNGTITQVDPSTDTVVRTIRLDQNPTILTYPTFVEANTVNGMLYVGTGRGIVYVVNPFTSTIVTTIAVNFPVGGMAFNPVNRMLYVTLPQNNPNDSVAVIDTSTNSLVTNIPIEPAPFGVTVNPSNGMVYVASEHAAVTVITSANTVTATITPPTVGAEILHPHGITFNPDNGKIYVTGLTPSRAFVFAIDSTNSISGSPIQIGHVSHEIAYDSSNGNLYATNWGTGTVSVISTSPPSHQEPSSICPDMNIQHWDKIVFTITSPVLAKKANVSANTELDIKVPDNPKKVADLKQKILDFLRIPNENKSSLKIIDVDYAIICGKSPTTTASGTPVLVPSHNVTMGNVTTGKFNLTQLILGVVNNSKTK